MGAALKDGHSTGTILVVDDEATLADLMADELESEGYNILQAHDGFVALEMVQRIKTDLVITDFLMPGMTGLELARAIRSQRSSAELPIILVSGANGAVGRNHPDLFNAVLDRPYPVGRLLETVESVLTQ
jgi:CheY-like chemotaxis protein